MTSWRHLTHLFVFVFLNMVDLSQEGCYDHFDVKEWAGNLADSVSLVRTQDSKDVMECTVERECQRRRGTGLPCDLLGNCYDRDYENKTSEKCKGEISQDVYFYHFMCLVAKSMDHSPKGCEYDNVCKLNSETTSTVFYQTTTLPPPTTTLPPPATTLPPPTTTLPPPPPTTTLSPPTTAPTTTLPETTTATTVLSPTATTLAPSVIQSSVNGSHDRHSESKDETGALNGVILLMVSAIFNVIGPLAVYLYMRRQWMQDRKQWSLTHELNGNPPGDQPMAVFKSDTLLASANRAVETTHLIQPSECHSVLSADSV